MQKRAVAILIVVIFLAILGFDAWLYADDVPRNSFSQVIIDMSSQSALVPWFIGLVMGFLGAHWFDNYRQK